MRAVAAKAQICSMNVVYACFLCFANSAERHRKILLLRKVYLVSWGGT